ncbi:AAA family ATPase [Acidithiobacillus ferrianus]|uniref:AAA family ATPase n=2 Tax=Acidithiobacillus ferrianus TaxID=2678518 RepID=A0A845U889_9PROT|nr:AAA family ATPase [Acidithiobacillus ferrianus]NDU43902.1 AAA family ATPase [Acidithiobacillus ferrianus]
MALDGDDWTQNIPPYGDEFEQPVPRLSVVPAGPSAGADAALPEPEAPRPPLFTRIGELLAHPQPVDWLVKGWLERDTTAALIAEPGRGKSFAALDMACCVALGRDWHGIPTKQAPVLFLAGEGRAAMVRRACAWSIVYESLSTAPLHLSSGAE